MALLKQCFCYSLRQGAFIIGSYSLVVYCVAFAVELWWIVEALLILPAPAYTLCALYFFNFVMAAVLLFGLLVRQRKYLMSWSLMTVLSFFPEAGMVLFMSLYYWPTQKYEYGVIELVYWSLRAIFNIFGALCVCSLYLSWRDEELILGRLHDLTLAEVENGSNGVIGYRNTLKTQGRLSHSLQASTQNLGYHNFGYLDSSSGAVYSPEYTLTLKPALRRASQSFSTHHQSHYQSNAMPGHQRSRASFHAPSGLKSEFNPALMFEPNYRKSRISELGIAGIGLERPEAPGSVLQRTKSLWNVTNDDYWARPPPSRPVSMGYVNHAMNLENAYNNNCANGKDTLSNHHLSSSKGSYLASLDNRKSWMMHMGRKAASMDGINHFYRYYGQNIVANNNNHFTSNWSKSSLEFDSDDI